MGVEDDESRSFSQHRTRVMRISAELIQQDLARYLNTDQSTMSRIESEHSWVTPMLERQFAEAYGGIHHIQTHIEALKDVRERHKHHRPMPA